jgi:hypothetical protein
MTGWFLSSSATVSGGSDGPAVSNGLYERFQFDEGSGTETTGDQNGTVGTLQGDPTWTTLEGDSALGFDGTGDYVALPNLGFGGGNQSISIVARMQVDSNAGTDLNIFGFGEKSTNNTFAFGVVEDGKYVIYFWSNGHREATDNFYGTVVTATATYDYSTGDRTIYENDTQLGVTDGGQQSFTEQNYRIAGYNGDSFNGIMREVLIYDRALTATEVSTIHNGYTG